ncbi:MAG: hypothetical protein JOY64_29930 [Alphaproteobacteria bacterium]|nr:hypothetical protein [Alphaproteobacteria bacterium]MBV8411882.1 hypothetical protein [Alphaproteobacteria bacterium]
MAIGFAAAGLSAGSASAQGTGGLPDYLANIVAPLTPPSAADLATRDVLQLDVAMFALYDNAGKIFRQNIMAKHPILLALFSGAGGRMILYRPGKPPEEAPSVPIVYQVMKSTGHSTMAISEVVMPYIGNAADKSWVAPLLAYRTQMKSALDGVDTLPIQADWKPAVKEILANNVAFMDDCLAKGAITLEATQAFAKKQEANIKLIINWAASTQVKHWMGVVENWKSELGADWDKVYAASNTIYVARQNNVLFSVLAQFFPPEAINDRLMLIETVSFFTTPDDMLTSMTRIISDRSVGSLFFGNYHLMDYELMGGDGRKTIISEMQGRGKQPNLPPAVPFGSHQWPTLITPGAGATSLDDLK